MRRRRRLIRGIYLSEPPKKLTDFAETEKRSAAYLSEQLQIAKREIAAAVFGANGLLKTETGAAYVFTSESLKTALRSAGNVRQNRLRKKPPCTAARRLKI